MADWDHLMKNMRGGAGFTGRTQADEDVYYAAFADDAEPVVRFGALPDRLTSLIRLGQSFRIRWH